jgi:hypothetical protein
VNFDHKHEDSAFLAEIVTEHLHYQKFLTHVMNTATVAVFRVSFSGYFKYKPKNKVYGRKTVQGYKCLTTKKLNNCCCIR